MAYWQEFLPAAQDRPAVWHDHFDAAMPDGPGLRLPLRDLGATAVAGMIANQASLRGVRPRRGWLAGARRVGGRRHSIGSGFGRMLVLPDQPERPR